MSALEVVGTGELNQGIGGSCHKQTSDDYPQEEGTVTLSTWSLQEIMLLFFCRRPLDYATSW